jgi:hypothetical protein
MTIGKSVQIGGAADSLSLTMHISMSLGSRVNVIVVFVNRTEWPLPSVRDKNPIA